MGKVKELQLLDDAIFEIVYSLHLSMSYKNIKDYRLALAVLDQLNKEYFELTGQYNIPPSKTLEYHENQWSKF